MTYKNLLAFHNIGNNCYLNSALQALLSCDEFRECITITNKEKNKKGSHVPFLGILDEMVYKRGDPNIPISNPVLLKQMLSDHSSLFKDMDQQDCHECIITILDIIHENTKTKNNLKILSVNNRVVKKNSNIEKHADKQWDSVAVNGLSFTNYLFSGQLRSNLICQNCNFERNNFEIINNISLSLPDLAKIDIIDCFINYFNIEVLEKSNSVECEKCKIKTKHTKNLSLWRFPKILIIHLKRYTQKPNGCYTRNNCLVDFSPELIFREKSNKKSKLVYDLQCVVNHYGMTPMGGHYTSIVKHDGSDYEWAHIDDNSIYKYKEDKLITSSAYILIYINRFKNI